MQCENPNNETVNIEILCVNTGEIKKNPLKEYAGTKQTKMTSLTSNNNLHVLHQQNCDYRNAIRSEQILHIFKINTGLLKYT